MSLVTAGGRVPLAVIFLGSPSSHRGEGGRPPRKQTGPTGQSGPAQFAQLGQFPKGALPLPFPLLPTHITEAQSMIFSSQCLKKREARLVCGGGTGTAIEYGGSMIFRGAAERSRSSWLHQDSSSDLVKTAVVEEMKTTVSYSAGGAAYCAVRQGVVNLLHVYGECVGAPRWHPCREGGAPL